MQLPNIAFIGAGNMGRALIGGLTRTASFPAQPVGGRSVRGAAANWRARSLACARLRITWTPYRTPMCVIVAVKPQVMRGTMSALARAVASRRPLVISVAAGIRIDAIATWLNGHERIVRTMPNRPALLGCGVTALFAPAHVNAADRELASTILGSVGPTVWLDREELIDVVTAVSGSGPAYFFRLIELLEEAGRELGLPASVARTLSIETAYGAGCMAHQRSSDPAELRAQVTSKGGTTEAAFRELEAADLRGIVTRAVTAAARRSAELAEQFGG